MRQIILDKGEVKLEEVPIPKCNENEVLVKSSYSLISPGTESLVIQFSKANIIKKALSYPDKIAKGLKILQQKGISETFKIANDFLNAPKPLGYSLSGTVIEIGKNVKNIKVGDNVACASPEFSNHAEYIKVPEMLCTKIPENVSLKEGCSITLGVIAIHGVRQVDPKIGETVVVFGLGLIGQIACQLLLANGTRVIGIDINKNRCEKAKKLGVDIVLNSNEVDIQNEINKITNDTGVDATLITASDQTSGLVNLSLEITRKRGTVVALGYVGLNIKRFVWYSKEIDLKISNSYGPGKNDEDYEKKNLDYPFAYVRWTENRNMIAFLSLISQKKIRVSEILEKEFNFENAIEAYKLLGEKECPLGIVFKYGSEKEEISHSMKLPKAINEKEISKIKVGIIGLGNFITSTHIPNLLKLKDLYIIKGLCDNDQVKLKFYGKKLQAEFITTDYMDLIHNPEIDILIVGTRHNNHYEILMEALRNNKNIFLEKPLCINIDELAKIKEYVAKQNKLPFVTVGFNRRFSPALVAIKESFKTITSPVIINYKVCDTKMDKNHWVNTQEGGGRIIGNACHMIDVFTYLLGTNVKEIKTTSIKSDYQLKTDNYITTIEYNNGSIANLIYTTLSNKNTPKEKIEVYGNDLSYYINDFKDLTVFGKAKGLKSRKQDKGFLNELKELANALKNHKELIEVYEIIKNMEIVFEINNKVNL